VSIIYEQSTGRINVREGSRPPRLVAMGYSGSKAGINAPEMEHKVGIGPIPQGSYFLRERHHQRFAAPSFACEPTLPTAAKLAGYGRSGFWIHGDNAKGDLSGSSGCIVVSRGARIRIARLIRDGHSVLTVVR